MAGISTQDVLRQAGYAGWNVVSIVPQMAKNPISANDWGNGELNPGHNTEPYVAQTPTGQYEINITSPDGKLAPQKIVVGADATALPDPSYLNRFFDVARKNGADPFQTPVKIWDANTVVPPDKAANATGSASAPPGWTGVQWIASVTGGPETMYGVDPKDGQYKQVPNVPARPPAATAATAKPVTPTADLNQVTDPTTGKVIGLRDPSTGTTIPIPAADTVKSGKADVIQGSTIYHVSYDAQGNPHVDSSETAPDPNKVPDGTQTTIPAAGGWGIPAIYKNGQPMPTGAPAVALTPQAQRPPQEGDTRPNVQSGYSIQEVYRGGQWVVDTSVKPTSFVPQPPQTINTGTGRNIVQQDAQGNLSTLPNPNTTDVAGQVSQLQAAAAKQRDALNAKVASGALSADEAGQQFDQWWQTNVQPYAQQLSQQQAQTQQTAQQAADANQRANLQTAQTAGQNAVNNAQALMPNIHSQKFLDQYAAALNGVAHSTTAGVNFTGDAFGVQAPDLNAIAQQATNAALAHISPTAAGNMGQSPQAIPQGLDVNAALNESTYRPSATTTIAPDGTVTIQHTPQQPFPQSGIPEGSNRGLPPPVAPGPLAPNEMNIYGTYAAPAA